MTVSKRVNEALADDRLADAIKITIEETRKAPSSIHPRALLIELLILAGDYARADKQADMAAAMAPSDAVGLSILRGQIRGMDARAEWFRNNATPAFPDGPTEADKAVLQLNLALKAYDHDAIRASAEAVQEVIGTGPGLAWNGTPAPDLRDADDRLPHALEAITTGGAYLWIDLARVKSVDFEPLRRPMDLAYRRATVELKSGSQAELLLPSIYGPLDDTDESTKLGRKTDWVDLPGNLVAGKGMRCFLAGDELEPFATAIRIEAGPEAAVG